MVHFPIYCRYQKNYFHIDRKPDPWGKIATSLLVFRKLILEYIYDSNQNNTTFHWDIGIPHIKMKNSSSFVINYNNFSFINLILHYVG